MIPEDERSTRREFMGDVGRLASAVALPASLTAVSLTGSQPLAPPDAAAEWDLSWLELLATATDRAVFDWPTMGDPGDPMIFQFAARYLDNCAEVYGSRRYDARVLLNVRTQAVPVALTDGLWERLQAVERAQTALTLVGWRAELQQEPNAIRIPEPV